MVNYEPLWETMKLKKVTTYALIHKYKISSKTVNNLKPVSYTHLTLPTIA